MHERKYEGQTNGAMLKMMMSKMTIIMLQHCLCKNNKKQREREN